MLRPWLLVGIIALTTGLGHLRPIQEVDTPMHLTQAETVLRLGTAVYPDETSFTVPGRPFHDHPWLGQLMLWSAYQVGGFEALSVLTALLGALAVVLVGWAAWVYSERRPWITELTTATVAAVIAWRVTPRPLLLFLIFLPLALVLVYFYMRADPRRRFVWGLGLVALQVVWIPSHGSFVLLPVLTLIAVGSMIPTEGFRKALCGTLVVVPMVLVMVALTDVRAHLGLIGNVALGDATRHISEMRPLKLGDLMPHYVNSIFFLDLLLALAGWRITYRLRSSKSELPGSSGPRSKDWPRGYAWSAGLADASFFMLGLALTLTARRFRAAWAVLTIPLVVRPRADDDGTEPGWLRYAALVAALTFVPAVIDNDIRREPSRGFGVGLDRDAFPVDVAEFVKGRRLVGNLLNPYDDGGYLYFALRPDVKIAIDGRTPTVFDDELFFLIREAGRNPHALRAFVRRYAPDMVLTRQDWPQCALLRADPGWRPVFIDAERALFLHRGFREDVEALAALDPCRPQESLRGACSRDPSVVNADLGAMATGGRQPPFVLRLRSEFAGACRRDYSEARRWAAAALEGGTRRPEAWMTYARAVAASGPVPEALEAIEQALQMGAGPDAEWMRARLYLRSGQTAVAAEAYSALASRWLDRMPPEARLEYAEALMAEGQEQAAVLHLQRVLWTVTSTRARRLREQLVGDGVRRLR